MLSWLLLLILLTPLETASLDDQLLTISSATARTSSLANPPGNVIDGDLSTIYHTKMPPEPVSPKWLKLQLEEPALVSRVVIVNR